VAGHSKWKNIQHRKGKQDAAKGQLFTKLAREIAVSVRHGGGEAETNFRLKIAIEKARLANMPTDNIQRTIDKALGNIEGVSYEEITYEGYTPGGAAVMIELMTDNRNRTAGEVRHIFTKRGGSLGVSNCVAWMFDRKGVLEIDESSVLCGEDALMLLLLEAGAEDVTFDSGTYEVITSADAFQTVKETLEQQAMSLIEANITFVPQTTTELRGDDARMALSLIQALEENDDVQNVYTNADFGDALDD